MSLDPIKLPLRHWSLDPALTFLNHGSYGSVPAAAAERLAELRARCERDPVRFFKADLEGLLDSVRAALGDFLNCRPADLALVPNATIALATILANTPLQPGDEILITDHEYQSLLNELERVAVRTGARVVQAPIPFPGTTPQAVVDSFLSAITPRTRLAIISHVTSASALVLPVTPIVREFNRRGIDIVVDGAHSPGQVPVDVRGLDPTYFVGSGHKWLCGPKGSAFLYVRPDRQPAFRSLYLSSRAHKDRPARPRFLRDFDYHGTADYTPILALPAAIKAVGEMLPGGWPAVMRHNQALALKARDALCRALGIPPPAPDSMLGAMASVPLPEPAPALADRPTAYDDALQDELLARHGIQVPIWRLNAGNQRILRLSAHLYNTPDHYQRLAGALTEELAREKAVRASA